MRVAIVAPHYPEYSLNYGVALSRHCDVLACVDEQQLEQEFDGRQPPTSDRLQTRRVRFKTAGDLLRLLALVRCYKPDVLHVQEAVGPRRAMFTAVLAAMIGRAALVALTVHDPEPHAGRDVAAARRTARVGGYLRRRADVIVVHGAFCERLMRERIDAARQRIVVSDHGVILAPTVHQPAPVGALQLYFFGRMEAYKGLEVLLQAAEMLHESGFPFALTIAGKGPELDRLGDRFRRLPEVTVHTGFISPASVINSIQGSDCVVVPYLSATQSGVLAAAIAGERFVIASATGGIVDVVEHGSNGWLVAPGDVVALATAIRVVGSDVDMRRRLLAGAARTARTQLNWDVISTRAYEAFVAALGSRARLPIR